jgi:hypothetical protein
VAQLSPAFLQNREQTKAEDGTNVQKVKELQSERWHEPADRHHNLCRPLWCQHKNNSTLDNGRGFAEAAIRQWSSAMAAGADCSVGRGGVSAAHKATTKIDAYVGEKIVCQTPRMV